MICPFTGNSGSEQLNMVKRKSCDGFSGIHYLSFISFTCQSYQVCVLHFSWQRPLEQCCEENSTNMDWFIPAWVNNYIHHEICDESNFISHLTIHVITYPCCQTMWWPLLHGANKLILSHLVRCCWFENHYKIKIIILKWVTWQR